MGWAEGRQADHGRSRCPEREQARHIVHQKWFFHSTLPRIWCFEFNRRILSLPVAHLYLRNEGTDAITFMAAFVMFGGLVPTPSRASVTA
jgi:hypothetical protein